MKNRDKYLLKRNEYDILMQFQRNIFNGGCGCVIDGLTGEFRDCPKEWRDAKTKIDVCSKCIQDWLNEES